LRCRTSRLTRENLLTMLTLDVDFRIEGTAPPRANYARMPRPFNSRVKQSTVLAQDGVRSRAGTTLRTIASVRLRCDQRLRLLCYISHRRGVDQSLTMRLLLTLLSLHQPIVVSTRPASCRVLFLDRRAEERRPARSSGSPPLCRQEACRRCRMRHRQSRGERRCRSTCNDTGEFPNGTEPARHETREGLLPLFISEIRKISVDTFRKSEVYTSAFRPVGGTFRDRHDTLGRDAMDAAASGA
jgi:hypothetical protein